MKMTTKSDEWLKTSRMPGLAGFARTASAGRQAASMSNSKGGAGMRTPDVGSHIKGFLGDPPMDAPTTPFTRPMEKDLPGAGWR